MNLGSGVPSHDNREFLPKSRISSLIAIPKKCAKNRRESWYDSGGNIESILGDLEKIWFVQNAIM